MPRDVSDRSGVGYAELSKVRKFGWDREAFNDALTDLDGVTMRRLCRLEPSRRLAYMMITNINDKERAHGEIT